MDLEPRPRPARRRLALRLSGVLCLLTGVALAVLAVLRPATVAAVAEQRLWSLAAALVVLGILLLAATAAALAGAVVTVLVAYVVLAAPAPPGPVAAADAPGDERPTDGVPRVAPLPDRYPALGVSAGSLPEFERFVEVTGTRPDVFDMFVAWSRDEPLDLTVARNVVTRGVQLSLTWEPWDPEGDHRDQPRYSLASIARGVHDDYIDRFARSVREVPGPVTIRLMHEMNGNWYPWGSGVNGNRPGEFVAAWRHVVDRFAALGVRNVSWTWSPNAVYTGGAELAPLYPGDDYVDAVGVSNYNWGDYARDGFATRWSTFGELFDPSIAALSALTDRPIWITEVGSSDFGGSKAAWLADALAEIQRRPQLAGLVWFDHEDVDAGVDWRIEGDPEAVAAWRAGFEARPVVPGAGGPGRRAN